MSCLLCAGATLTQTNRQKLLNVSHCPKQFWEKLYAVSFSVHQSEEESEEKRVQEFRNGKYFQIVWLLREPSAESRAAVHGELSMWWSSLLLRKTPPPPPTIHCEDSFLSSKRNITRCCGYDGLKNTELALCDAVFTLTESVCSSTGLVLCLGVNKLWPEFEKYSKWQKTSKNDEKIQKKIPRNKSCSHLNELPRNHGSRCMNITEWRDMWAPCGGKARLEIGCE